MRVRTNYKRHRDSEKDLIPKIFMYSGDKIYYII